MKSSGKGRIGGGINDYDGVWLSPVRIANLAMVTTSVDTAFAKRPDNREMGR